MFRDVPECSGMFHVPGFINGRLKHLLKQLIILGEIQSQSSLNFMIANYKFWCTFEIRWVRVLENRADRAAHPHQRFR